MVKIYKLSVFIIFLISAIKVNGHVNAYSPFLPEAIYAKTVSFNSELSTNGNTYFSHNQLSSQQQLGFTTYPNPVATHTTISYLLPSKSNVVLKVIDLAGKQLAVLFQQEQAAGRHEYNWELSKNKITTGMYILVLQVNKLSYTKKIIVQ